MLIQMITSEGEKELWLRLEGVVLPDDANKAEETKERFHNL